MEGLKKEIRLLEDDFIRTRWLEARIRGLYYDKLWAARIRADDPLSKDTRQAGREEESQILKLLSSLEGRSQKAALRLGERLAKLKQGHLPFLDCCKEASYTDCVETGFQPVFQKALDYEKALQHITEGEHEYRTVVALTAAGKQGLYPQDALEKPEDHTDYYSRFESERAGRRYEEDAQTMNFFYELDQILEDLSEGKGCCLQCGK